MPSSPCRSPHCVPGHWYTIAPKSVNITEIYKGFLCKIFSFRLFLYSDHNWLFIDEFDYNCSLTSNPIYVYWLTVSFFPLIFHIGHLLPIKCSGPSPLGLHFYSFAGKTPRGLLVHFFVSKYLYFFMYMKSHV